MNCNKKKQCDQTTNNDKKNLPRMVQIFLFPSNVYSDSCLQKNDQKKKKKKKKRTDSKKKIFTLQAELETLRIEKLSPAAIN